MQRNCSGKWRVIIQLLYLIIGFMHKASEIFKSHVSCMVATCAYLFQCVSEFGTFSIYYSILEPGSIAVHVTYSLSVRLFYHNRPFSLVLLLILN